MLSSSFKMNSLIATGALIGVFSIATQTWYTVQQDRLQVMSAERSNGLIAVRILEEHASQTLNDGVSKLDSIAKLIATRTNDSGWVARTLENQLEKDERYIKSVRFIDNFGHSWIRSRDFPAHQLDSNDKTEIRNLLTHPEMQQVQVGHPYQSPYDNQLVIPLVKNVYDSKNQRVGIIAIDIRLNYFADLYARVAKENNAMLALIANQGFILVRSPFEARYLDRDISLHALTQGIADTESEAAVQDIDWLDDEAERYYVYRKLHEFPLTVVYGRDLESLLTPWRERSEARVGITMALTAGLCLVLFILAWQLQRLRQAEARNKQNEMHFAQVFSRSPNALTLVNLDTTSIEAVNNAWLSLFDYSATQILGDFRELQRQIWQDQQRLQEFSQLLLAGQDIDRYNARLRKRNGQEIICWLSARPYGDESQHRYIITSQDVTAQVQAETEIRELNAELEQRVQQRTSNLAKSNEELAQALSSLKAMQTEVIRQEKLASLGALVAGIAHELNTPIGNSVTIASTMLDETQRCQQAIDLGQLKRTSLLDFLGKMKHGSDVLLRSLSRASELILSFKHVAVDQSSEKRRKFDLRIVLEEIVLTNSSLYSKTPFTLELELSEAIHMNSFPGALGQVITNLITNAIKHGFEGRPQGRMKLQTFLDQQQVVNLIFRDDGNGIAEQHLQRIYDPFFTTKFGQGGSGLGLHIVYNLVTEILGGKIEVKSNASQGTEIYLKLPLKAP